MENLAAILVSVRNLSSHLPNKVFDETVNRN